MDFERMANGIVNIERGNCVLANPPLLIPILSPIFTP